MKKMMPRRRKEAAGPAGRLKNVRPAGQAEGGQACRAQEGQACRAGERESGLRRVDMQRMLSPAMLLLPNVLSNP
jgi:hypothetical protein